jgi:DNA polymerase-4
MCGGFGFCENAIRAAIEGLAEHCGFQMRRDKLGATVIKIIVVYSDGVKKDRTEKLKKIYVLDRDISNEGINIYRKMAFRRIRIRSVGISLEGLTHLSYEPDLFEQETDTANRKLQEAVDKIQDRFGEGKITKATLIHNKLQISNKKLGIVYED